MEFDQALEMAKPLGRTQFVVTFISCFVIVITSWVNLSNVFITEISEFHCARSPDLTLEESVPLGNDGLSYAECEQYVNLNVSTEVKKCTNGWDYDTELFGESVTTEFDLVCGRDSLPGLSQSIVIAGRGAGNIFWGPLADKWGRRPTLISSLILFIIVGVAIAFSNNYIMFASCRFLLAFIQVGSLLPSTILSIEYLTPKHRSTLGNLPGLFFAFGLLILPGLAFLVKDWRWFSVSLVVPTVILFPLIWFVPESPRWLLSVSNAEKAEKAMQTVARLNKAKDIPESFFQVETEPVASKETGNKRLRTQKLGFLHLFKRPTLGVTIALSFQWFAFFLVYFGFALSTADLAGDPYVSFVISALVEIPARLIPLCLLKISGRILLTSLSFVFGGIMMIAMVILDSGTISFTVCALVGKFCISITYQPIMLLTSEVFPTTIRNVGAGMVQGGGRLGSIISPILLYLDKEYRGLAFGSMAFFSCFAAVVIFALPETLNTVQPNTTDDLRVLLNTRRLISRKGLRTPGKSDAENTEEFKHDNAVMRGKENKENGGNTIMKKQVHGERKEHEEKEVEISESKGGIENPGFEDSPGNT